MQTNDKTEVFLQHGKAGTPMRTEKVPFKVTATPKQPRTQSGYSEKSPTHLMVKYNNRWRRVYSYCISNTSTLFIGRSLRDGIIVDVYA